MHFLGRYLYIPHLHGLTHRHRHTSAQKAREDIEKGPPHLNITVPGPTSFKPSDVIESADKVKTYRTLPIFSGIMIPFSIMLSIPSLVGHWYIRTENNVTTEIRPNPVLLDVGIAFSMACAFLANAFLVIRFAERGIKLMTLASIVFLSLHDVIIIPIVTAFGIIHRIDDGFTYGQSFWFSVCSTIVSSVTNITLVVDYVTTKDFANSGSGLTSKQRSVVIVVIILLSYISFGSLIQAKLLDISFIDALYFSVATIETIGFGDIYPNSSRAKVFSCFYIAGGILNLALALGLARDAILESSVVELQHRLKVRQRERRLRSRWRAAVRWRLREQGHPMWVHHHRHEYLARDIHNIHGSRWYDRITRIRDKIFRDAPRDSEDPAWKLQYGPRHKRLNVEALTYENLHAAALETGAPLSRLVPEEIRVRQSTMTGSFSQRPTVEHSQGLPSSMSLTRFRLGGMLGVMGNFASAVAYGASDSPSDPDVVANLEVQDNMRQPDNITLQDERDRICNGNEDQQMGEVLTSPSGHGIPLTTTATIHEDDVLMEGSFEEDAKYLFYTRLSIAILLFLVFWMAGSAIFMMTENWTFGSSAYFCFISFTTVGYGDFSPKTPAGRSIFIVWALLGVATMTIIISILSEAYSQRYKTIIKSEVYFASPTTTARQFSRYPSINTGLDQGRFLSFTSPVPGIVPQDVIAVGGGGNSTPRITRAQGSSVDNDIAELSESVPISTVPRSVLVQVDHLKSLITITRAQRNLELNRSHRLESVISQLEKTLRDIDKKEDIRTC